MAETPIINGTLAPVLTGRRIGYDPSRGLTYTEEFESAGENLGALADVAINERLTVDHTPSGKVSRLSITRSGVPVGGTDIEADTWQVLANEIALKIGEHPNVLAFPMTGPGSYSHVLEMVELRRQSYLFEPSFTANTIPATQLFNLLVNGTDSFLIGQYVLRHTTNVSGQYAVNVADENVEYIYSTSRLVAEVSDAGSWTFPCPPRLIYKIQNIPPQFVTNGDLYWGWRKLPSTETTAANNRIDINTEYVLFGWSKLLYPILP